jgi:uncharacterized protein (DUF433 family)
MIMTTTFTTTEAAALVDLPERQIRKEFEHGLLSSKAKPRLSFSSLVYLLTLKQIGLELGVADRKRLLKAVRNALAHGAQPEEVPLTTVLTLQIGTVVRDVESKVKAFETWKAKLVCDEAVLGGEPVFPRSRLAVRHVGAIAERGEPVERILEDYPYVTERDVEFARTFARAYPRAGRPREPRQATAR